MPIMRKITMAFEKGNPPRSWPFIGEVREQPDCSAMLHWLKNVMKTEVISNFISRPFTSWLQQEGMRWKRSRTLNTWAHGSWDTEQHGQWVEVQASQIFQNRIILCEFGIHSSIQLWMLDLEADSSEVSVWVLYQNAGSSIQQKTGWAHYQQTTVWGSTRVSEKIVARRTSLASYCYRHRDLPAS